MKKPKSFADEYEKIVYWSDEGQCFIGLCPELCFGGVHGDDSIEVFGRESENAVCEINN